MAIKFESGAHWYTKDGNPQHDADLRAARKAVLYPSVTTIDKDQFKNDFLDHWKIDQVVLAASENPKMPHESSDEYGQRVYELSLNKARVASEFGKTIHDVCEHYPQMPIDQSIIHWFMEFEKWWVEAGIQPISRESVLVDSDIGVAGRTDLIALHKGDVSVVDFKTQDVKTDKKSGKKKPAFYDSWPRQLSFYASAHAKAAGMFPSIPKCVSLVIDSNEGGLIYEKVWDKNDILSSYEDFTLAAWAWQKKRKFWPAGQWTITQNIPMPS